MLYESVPSKALLYTPLAYNLQDSGHKDAFEVECTWSPVMDAPKDALKDCILISIGVKIRAHLAMVEREGSSDDKPRYGQIVFSIITLHVYRVLELTELTATV